MTEFDPDKVARYCFKMFKLQAVINFMLLGLSLAAIFIAWHK